MGNVITVDGDQFRHAEQWVLFPHNLREYLSVDETALSNGELYTIVTNKAAKGRQGALVVMINGTKSDDVISVLKKLPESKRKAVKEVTLDMVGSMNKIVQVSFLKAVRVIDRFHVQKLAYDALQEMRIAHRWDAKNEEAEAMKTARYEDNAFQPFVFDNGDAKKQLLARSRYLFFKSTDKLTIKQNK